MHTALQKAKFPAVQPLRCCRLLADGNAHRPDLLACALPEFRGAAVSESLLPQIRATAQLIAASRHDFGRPSPAAFTDEADWFAARILVLRVRVFHLDVAFCRTIETANHRAAEFAAVRRLPFTPAKLRLSLHKGRPQNLLIMDCALDIDGCDFGLIENSRRLAALLR